MTVQRDLNCQQAHHAGVGTGCRIVRVRTCEQRQSGASGLRSGYNDACSAQHSADDCPSRPFDTPRWREGGFFISLNRPRCRIEKYEEKTSIFITRARAPLRVSVYSPAPSNNARRRLILVLSLASTWCERFEAASIGTSSCCQRFPRAASAVRSLARTPSQKEPPTKGLGRQAGRHSRRIALGHEFRLGGFLDKVFVALLLAKVHRLLLGIELDVRALEVVGTV